VLPLKSHPRKRLVSCSAASPFSNLLMEMGSFLLGLSSGSFGRKILSIVKQCPSLVRDGIHFGILPFSAEIINEHIHVSCWLAFESRQV
jgi:hypothetical protein